MELNTCWTVIRGAAAGSDKGREDFAQRYLPAVTAYPKNRRRGTPYIDDLEDAIQEVFLDCQGGALERVDEERSGGFRPFLYGVVRNVALQTETKRARRREQRRPSSFDLADDKARDKTLSKV